MLKKSGIISAVSANAFTVQIERENTCNTCRGCAGLANTNLTIVANSVGNRASDQRFVINESVEISLGPRSLATATFIWFAIPVLLLLGVFWLGQYFEFSETITVTTAIAFVGLFYGGLTRFQAAVTGANLLNNLTITGSKLTAG